MCIEISRLGHNVIKKSHPQHAEVWVYGKAGTGNGT